MTIFSLRLCNGLMKNAAPIAKIRPQTINLNRFLLNSSFATCTQRDSVRENRNLLLASSFRSDLNFKTKLFTSSIVLNSSHNQDSTLSGNNSTANVKRLETAFLARQFITTLTTNERIVIREELDKFEKEQAAIGLGNFSLLINFSNS